MEFNERGFAQCLAHSESQYVLIVVCEALGINKWTRKHSSCSEGVYNIVENRVWGRSGCYKSKEEGGLGVCPGGHS